MDPIPLAMLVTFWAYALSLAVMSVGSLVFIVCNGVRQ
jgi:hypothetical protein